MKTVRLRISGLVQGVGYRDWTMRTASALGLYGWVRNRADDTVEMVIQAEDRVVEQMVALCREGPRAAQVADIRITPEPALVDLNFRCLPTE